MTVINWAPDSGEEEKVNISIRCQTYIIIHVNNLGGNFKNA